jgi:serine/threonine protein phosphatase PrpC
MCDAEWVAHFGTSRVLMCDAEWVAHFGTSRVLMCDAEYRLPSRKTNIQTRRAQYSRLVLV